MPCPEGQDSRTGYTPDCAGEMSFKCANAIFDFQQYLGILDLLSIQLKYNLKLS